MDRTPGRATFNRLIAPWGLFLGLAVSFLGCCLGGYLASRRNHFHHFERFHVYLTPESMFYPTACQLRQLAKSRLDPGKIVVLVGGTSVLNGTGQRVARLWTRHLQALLGGQYQVINFGFRAAQVQEIGAIAAEMICRDYPRLILVTDIHPASMHSSPDGFLYRYFYWDAYYKGLLLPHPAREQRLRESLDEPEPVERFPASQAGKSRAERQEELKDQMRLDSTLYFTDLWNTLAYTRFATLWSLYSRGSVLRARRHYPDGDRGSDPFPLRYNYDLTDGLAQVRGLAGSERNPPAWWSNQEKYALASFPGPVRRRCLLVIAWHSAFFLQKLSAAERAAYGRVSRRTVEHLEKIGFATVEVGRGYLPSDYADLQHLDENGGEKMAAAVAVKVRQLARRLGYVKGNRGAVAEALPKRR
jgi:hypothetical protein